MTELDVTAGARYGPTQELGRRLPQTDEKHRLIHSMKAQAKHDLVYGSMTKEVRDLQLMDIRETQTSFTVFSIIE